MLFCLFDIPYLCKSTQIYEFLRADAGLIDALSSIVFQVKFRLNFVLLAPGPYAHTAHICGGPSKFGGTKKLMDLKTY